VIYLDYAATAPMRPEVSQRLSQLWSEPLGNASSLHRHGHRARMQLEGARSTIAAHLSAKVEEVVLTSGATEANNLAVGGWMRMQPRGSHCLVGATEHPCVWDSYARLRHEGYAVEVIPVGQDGRVDPVWIEQHLTDQTALVSVMAVNNEVGTVQPITEIAALCERRATKLHVDAVQALWLDPQSNNIDLLSISAHKLGGPVGSGCLVVRRGLVLEPMLRGGSQEDGRRAGTSNVAAAVGLASALEATARDRAALQLPMLRADFEAQLRTIEGALCLSEQVERSPHISAWLFDGIAAEPLLVRLDLAGIAASSGSACSSHSLEPSRTVAAMGFSNEDSKGLVRFSFGPSTTGAELARAAEVLSRSIAELRNKRKESRV
jgi:cysteine desulfurase